MPWPLSPRAVALQGLGFATIRNWHVYFDKPFGTKVNVMPRLIALQGFWPTSPFRRAPLGPGFGARPVYGMRPMQANTVRFTSPNTTRPRR